MGRQKMNTLLLFFQMLVTFHTSLASNVDVDTCHAVGPGADADRCRDVEDEGMDDAGTLPSLLQDRSLRNAERSQMDPDIDPDGIDDDQSQMALLQTSLSVFH